MVIKAENPELLSIVSRILLNNGTAILPSDTLYGFSCIPGKAEKKIEMIKGRGEGKHFLKLALKEQLPMLTDQLPDPKLLSYWPGPLTLIMKGKNNPTEGIRVPDNQLIQNILRKVGLPIISTSVNYSGQSPMTSIEEIIKEFESRVDLIVDAGVLPKSLPSTIVDLTGSAPHLVRQGQLKVEL